MFKFLFFIFFFFILLVLLMGFSIIRTIKRVLFGSGNSKQTYQQQRNTSSNRSASGQASGQNKRTSSDYAETEDYDETNLYKRHKKVFGKDEGEYVDYEEIK